MTAPNTATREEWLAARKDLLVREKALSKERDVIAAARRALPWVKVETDYSFETEAGPATLGDLFDGHSQSIVQHFMMGPDWEQGCVSCSFWADGFNGTIPHLNARNIAFKVVARAPLEKSLYSSNAWAGPLSGCYPLTAHLTRISGSALARITARETP